jgi:hypothetical protein
MTRKENLLVEIYNLRNQISEIKGNTIVNIEEFSQTRKFRDEAASWKEFELKLRIEELKKNSISSSSPKKSLSFPEMMTAGEIPTTMTLNPASILMTLKLKKNIWMHWRKQCCVPKNLMIFDRILRGDAT